MGKRVGLMFRWPGCKGFLSVVWLCGWVGQRKGMNEDGEKQESRRLVGNVAWWDASRIHRGEERRKRRKGGKEKRRKKEEECRSWLCSNSKEHSRRTLSPLFLLSFLRLFVFLSFSILRNGGSAARRKIQQATGSRVMGMKNAFSSSFLLLSSTVSSPFWFLFSSTSLRVFFFTTLSSLLSFRRRWNHSENDSTRFRGTFVWRAFNARALHRGTPNVLMLPQKKLYGGEKPCIWFPVIVPVEIIPIRITTHDPRKLFADWNP